MRLEIITPTGIKGYVNAETDKDYQYFLKWVAKGYSVREIKIHKRELVECEACSS